MNFSDSLVPPRLLRNRGSAVEIDGRVQTDDPRLADVLPREAPLLKLYDGALHAEGPIWQEARERLVWSDVSNRRLLAWYPDGRVEVLIDRTWFINGNAIDAQGAVIHCEHGRRCISRSSVDVEDCMPQPIVTAYAGLRLNAPNDLTLGPDCAIWFTDPAFGILMPSQGGRAQPDLDHCSLYRFDPETNAIVRKADFEQPNGIAFAPDGQTLYVSDTSRSLGEIPGCKAGARHEVQAFDVASDGALSNRRFFCHADHGVPDGIAVDKRGWVWVATGDGVHVWSPERERMGFIPTSTIATNCAFGGTDGRRLFITATTCLLAIDLVS